MLGALYLYLTEVALITTCNRTSMYFSSFVLAGCSTGHPADVRVTKSPRGTVLKPHCRLSVKE